MLAAATQALALDPGPRCSPDHPMVAVPLAGVILSYCVGFGVILVLLVGRVAGRPLTPVEAVAAAVLLQP